MNKQLVIKTDSHKIMDVRAQVRAVIDGLNFVGEWSWDGENWTSSESKWNSIDEAIACAKRTAFLDFIAIRRRERI